MSEVDSCTAAEHRNTSPPPPPPIHHLILHHHHRCHYLASTTSAWETHNRLLCVSVTSNSRDNTRGHSVHMCETMTKQYSTRLVSDAGSAFWCRLFGTAAAFVFLSRTAVTIWVIQLISRCPSADCIPWLCSSYFDSRGPSLLPFNAPDFTAWELTCLIRLLIIIIIIIFGNFGPNQRNGCAVLNRFRATKSLLSPSVIRRDNFSSRASFYVVLFCVIVCSVCWFLLRWR